MSLSRRRNKLIAEFRRTQKLNRCTCRQRNLVIRIAGERKRRIRERENKATVANIVAVEHIRPNLQTSFRTAWRCDFDPNSKRLRRLVVGIHFC